jgi:hypothetical protein
VGDSLDANQLLTFATEKMQRDDRFRRTETAGKTFAPDFLSPNRPPSRCSPQALSEENT